MAAKTEADLGDEVTSGQRPRREGRQRIMMIAPKKKERQPLGAGRWTTRPTRRYTARPLLLVGGRRAAPTLGLHQKLCMTARSEEHTSELQSLMRISYAVFCLKKKKQSKYHIKRNKINRNTRQIPLYTSTLIDTK